MTRRRRDETRWSDRTARVATIVALPVALTSAAVNLAFGIGPDGTVGMVVAIAAPALAAGAAAAVTMNMMLIRRHRVRERNANRKLSAAKRELQDEQRERAVLRELDRALDLATTERGAIEVVREAFARHLSMQPIELHLVDPVDPVLTLALSSGGHQGPPAARCSPWDSVAARTNTKLVYDTTDRLDVCGHLRSRVTEPCSAVAIPLNAMGRLLGVLYGFGPDGQEPGVGDVQFLSDVASTIANRLALLRTAVGSTAATDDVDRLTGLPDRTATQERVLRMLRDRTPFTVAVADIDHFGSINRTDGRDAGDRALQLLARVARRTVRPGDVVGRIGGDEFLFVLPRTHVDDATRAFERIREELVLAQSTGEDPAFTISVGVIASSSGGSIEEILQRAARALEHAKGQGGNRVVVAHPARSKKSDNTAPE